MAAATSSSSLSIKDTFRDSVVLLTGATGYVGGLVLEALLRTTAVKTVYVLLRAKGQQMPEERLAKLLQVCPALATHATAAFTTVETLHHAAPLHPCRRTSSTKCETSHSCWPRCAQSLATSRCRASA
jgi:hypothetical protein